MRPVPAPTAYLTLERPDLGRRVTSCADAHRSVHQRRQRRADDHRRAARERASGRSARVHDRLGAAHPVEPRRPDRAGARGPGHQPHRARHRGDAHLSAPPAGDGAAGDVDPGRDGRPARRSASGRRTRSSSRACTASSTRVPPTTRASTSRCCGLRSPGPGNVEYHGEFFGFSSMLDVPGLDAGADHGRGAGAADAEARGRGHRRHHHVLGERAGASASTSCPRITAAADGARPADATGRRRRAGGGVRRPRRRTRAGGASSSPPT